MNTSALILMVTVESIATILTGWFFWKVLTIKPKDDVESENQLNNQP